MVYWLSDPAEGFLEGVCRRVLRGISISLLFALAVSPGLSAADGAVTAAKRSEAYYHFALGHLYHQFAQQFMRPEYVDRAVEEYSAALDADPGSIVIRIELINLYAGANRLSDAVAVTDEVFAQDPDNVEVRRLLGRIYRSYATGRRQGIDLELLQKAVEQFEKLVELEPDNPEDHVVLGMLYRSTERPEKAEQTLKRALELDPGQTDAQVELAYLLLQAGKIRTAISSLEEIVASGANERRHINALASAYEQTERYRDAAAMYARLLGQGGDAQDTLQTLRRLAENLFLSRQFGPALENYEALLKLDPGRPEYLLRISQIERIRENFSEAWDALDRARQLDPESVAVQFQAIGLFEAEGRIEEAASQIGEFLESTRQAEYTRPERDRRAMLLERLGALKRELDDTEGAIATFEEIGELIPESKPRVAAQVIETWRSARDFSRAEQKARKAAGEFPQDVMLVSLFASVLSDRGKTKEAIQVTEKLLKNDPSDINVLLEMARTYQKGRQFDDAAAAIDRARELSESDAERINVLLAYGSLYERAKQFDQAEAKFRELLEIDPDNAGALNYLGYMFADRSVHLDEAHSLIQRALDIEPNNGAYLDSLGWVYYRQNKLDLAVKFLERSLKQYRNDPIIHSHLGDVYFKQGRVDAAKEHWRRGLEEWKRSAPAERDPSEIESLRRKLSDLNLSMVEGGPKAKKKGSVER